MPSTAENVARILARDAVVREGLHREIINSRALARWMIATQGWDASEEAVLSALRRSPWARAPPDGAGLKRVLHGSHIDTTSNVCSVMLKRGLDSPSVRAAVTRLVKSHSGAYLRLVASEASARFVVRGDQLAALRRLLGEELIDDVRPGLTEVSIRQTKQSLAMPGAVASIVGALSFQGINFLGIVRHQLALQFLVDEADTPGAIAALTGLIGQT